MKKFLVAVVLTAWGILAVPATFHYLTEIDHRIYSAGPAEAPMQSAPRDRNDAVWNSSTPLNTTIELDVWNMGSAIAWQRPIGSVTGGALTFECTINGGATWVSLSGSNGDRVQTGVALSSSSTSAYTGAEAGWRFPIQSMDRIRIRLSTQITGTGSVAVSLRTTHPPVSPFGIARQDETGRLVTSGLASAGSVPTPVADGTPVSNRVDEYGIPFVRPDHPNRTTCYGDNIAAVLTELTNCGVQAGKAYYISSVIAISTTGTAGTGAIREGAGVNCGTSTVGVIPVLSTSRVFTYPANTGAPLVMNFSSPLKAVENFAICAIGSATNTLNITLIGYWGE